MKTILILIFLAISLVAKGQVYYELSAQDIYIHDQKTDSVTRAPKVPEGIGMKLVIDEKKVIVSARKNKQGWTVFNEDFLIRKFNVEKDGMWHIVCANEENYVISIFIEKDNVVVISEYESGKFLIINYAIVRHQ